MGYILIEPNEEHLAPIINQEFGHVKGLIP
jgi:hypothetical protein